ncbi:flippase-like domain-containing protein [Candidatus Woesearchaeota archaeon]|nr:flippase-like domain-containing protein [Candidatus Woesearchaeota archaeon]
MRKLAIAFSAAVGSALFLAVLLFAGFDSIIESFREFSPFYLLLFLLMSLALYITTTWRWATIVRYQGLKAPFITLLKYKVIASAVSYLTPAVRIGGEPLRGFLFKRKFGLKGSEAYSSVFLEMSIGIAIDTIFFCSVLFAFLVFFTIPAELEAYSMVFSVAALALVAAFYISIITHHGPLSLPFRALYFLIKANLLRQLVKRIVAVEDAMAAFLHFRKKGVFQAVIISLIGLPVTFFQYKFALLSIGVNVPFEIILLSIAATTIAGIVPIPAAFGIQELTNFSVFSIIGMPSVGFALSLIIRFKDILLSFIGMALLSYEGLNVLEILKSKKH